jgi:hypothetical protein
MIVRDIMVIRNAFIKIKRKMQMAGTQKQKTTIKIGYIYEIQEKDLEI